jgi:hypothetical protein
MSVAIAAFALILSGCSKGSDGAALAKVNRTTITAADFKKQIEDLQPQMRQSVLTDAKARKDFLEDLIGIELVVQEGKRLGLDKDAEYKKSMETHKKEIEEYKKRLDQKLQDVARDELFSGVLKKELGDKMGKVAGPSDKEVKEYYAKNKAKITAAFGKQVAFKEIEPQIKMTLMREKQREVYIEYAKALKEKATVSVDDKALDAMLAEYSKSLEMPEGLKATKLPAGKEATK